LTEIAKFTTNEGYGAKILFTLKIFRDFIYNFEGKSKGRDEWHPELSSPKFVTSRFNEVMLINAVG
jgi:hypothetical protein